MAHKATDPPLTVISSAELMDAFIPPFINNQYNNLTGADGGSPDVFIVRSEKVLFFAIVHRKKTDQYCGDGYVLLSSGEHLRFTASAEDRSEVVDRCTSVATKLARSYKGSFEKGTIDGTGHFRHL